MKNLSTFINESLVNEASAELFRSAAEKAKKYGQTEREKEFLAYADLIDSKKNSQVRAMITKKVEELAKKFETDEITVTGPECFYYEGGVGDAYDNVSKSTKKLTLKYRPELYLSGPNDDVFDLGICDSTDSREKLFADGKELLHGEWTAIYYFSSTDTFYTMKKWMLESAGTRPDSNFKPLQKVSLKSRKNVRILSDIIASINPKSKYADPNYLKA